MCVQVVSLGVLNWQLLAVWPNLSSGVNWSDISRRLESGSRETRHADWMPGTSEVQLHSSRSCFEAFFKAFRPRRTLHPRAGK